MPSDPRVDGVLESLAVPIERYRSAVAMTLEQIRREITAGLSDTRARADRLCEQLGPFAAAHIDPVRLAAFLAQPSTIDPGGLRRLDRASAVLQAVLEAGTELFHVRVPPGGDFGAAVSRQLATAGRAFAAARVAAATASGGATSGFDEAVTLEAFPFRSWNAAERRLAPPLVITVDGVDLLAGALVPFLDGAQKVVLIVEGPCPPAPLSRLITPGVLVVQSHDLAEMDRLARWPGAAAAALVPESALRFVHDPASGTEAWQRLSVQSSDGGRTVRLGGLSAEQQHEEVRQLHVVSTPPVQPAVNRSMEASPTAADRLASWLLQQSDLASPAPR